MRNDVSFLVDSQMTLFEQQSTFNPNMPLRGLMYFAQLYQMHLSRQRRHLFRSSIVKIPNPQFIVLYNGTRETDDREFLKLSDAFEKEDKSGRYEWTAELININPNHNQVLQKKCKPLYDYVRYVSRVKENKKKGMSLREAVDDAIEWAIKEDLLDGFFRIQKEEILANSLTEFDEEEFIRDIHQEGYDEGFSNGISQGIQQGISQGISQGTRQKAMEAARNALKMNLSMEQVAQITNLSLEEIRELTKATVKVQTVV